MRNVWIVVASGLLAFANFVKSQETQGGGRTLYSSRYDNLDIDTILSSNRLVNNYVDCLLSRKPCPPEGKDLKRILPEALRTKCSRCSSTQKENALKIITTLYYSYPNQYQALRERWDPSGEYHRRFEEYLRGIQFNQIGGNGNGNGPSERPVRNDFDRDQSQILLQTLILSTTTTTTTTTTAAPPVAASAVPEQRPQLASAQLTQPVAPITSTTPSTTTTSTTTTTTTSTTTTPEQTTATTPNSSSSVEVSSPFSPSSSSTSGSSGGGVAAESGEAGGSSSDPTTSIPATEPQPTVGPLSNRFGDDDSGVPVQTTQRPPVQTPTTTQRPVVVRQTTVRPVTQRTTSRFNPNQNQSPIVGLFNQIGNKLATTADAIAGMLRKTVDVIVTSHIQSHQRALRSFGAQQ